MGARINMTGEGRGAGGEGERGRVNLNTITDRFHDILGFVCVKVKCVRNAQTHMIECIFFFVSSHTRQTK